MRESAGLLPLKSQSPFVQLLVTLIVISGIALISTFLILLFARLIFGIGIGQIDYSTDLPAGENFVSYLRFVQSFQHLSVFFFPALLISFMMTGNIKSYLGLRRNPGFSMVLVIISISIFAIPIISSAGIINSGLNLPDWMSGIEKWMIQKEEQANTLTRWMIEADNLRTLFINILILAIIPAVGEELLFRGIIQQILKEWLKSGHLSVWITSFLFSSLHLQFYGFIPRFILGLIFGYLFLWSSSIWLPLIAHFINNLVPVLGAYFVGWEALNDKVSHEISGQVWIILFASISLIILMDLTRRHFLRKQTEFD